MRSMLEKKCKGESTRPPLLLVHGAWHGAWCWEPFMDYMAQKGFNSYAFDLPGHGTRKSEGVVGLGIMDYVSELESAISESTIGELTPAKPVLIGHSMGGLVVQKYLEKNKAIASVMIAPCPGIGSSLWLPLKYFFRQPIAGTTATLGCKTSIRDPEMCKRLFFGDITVEKCDTHFERLGLESSRAIRQMVLPGFKLMASKITTTPVAIAAAGRDYFFEFKRLQNWAKDSDYDFLAFPEAAHNFFAEPEKYDFGKTICKWLDKRISEGDL